MIRPFGNSIRNRVTAAILLTSLVSLAVSFSVLLVFEWRNAERELLQRMTTAGGIVRENIAAALAFQAVDDAEKMLSSLQIDKEIIAAALYNQSGERIAGYVRNQHSFKLPSKPPEQGVNERADEVLIVLPIEMGGEQLGSLLLASDYEARNERFALYFATASGMFLLAIGVAGILSRILEERISKPILSLVDSTRRVTEERDYSVRVKAADTQEVALLADSFNTMLREVNHREAQLRQAMDRLRLTLEASKTYTWEWNQSDNTLTWHMTEQLPTALAKLQGKALGDFLLSVHPKDQKALAEAYETAIAERDEFGFEFRLLTDGDPIDLECRGKGFRDEQGRITRALGVASDVTQRRQTERALYWREQEFRALVEHSPDMIARYTRDLRVEYVNPAVVDYTGLPVEHFLGRTLPEIGTPKERVALWRHAVERIFDGASQAEIEFEYGHTDGSTRFFLSRLVPEFAPSGEVEHVLSVSREISERKRYEEELQTAVQRAEAAAQAKSVFLSNMSHDIRTPLTTILGCAELLEARGDEESREMIEMVKSGGKRLMDTLNSVLDLARLEGGEAELDFEALDVTTEISELVRLFQVKADEKGLDLAFQSAGVPVFGLLDRAAFNRVMMNLLGNALKFTQRGSVDVRLWREEDRFLVAVEDTGPGIPDETLATIFDAFTRSRQSEVRQVEGSGLGMTITRHLVRLMRGDIEVRSELGKGSVFTISLECADFDFPNTAELEPLDESAVVASDSGSAVGRKPTILAVEDNANTMRLLELLLAKRYDAEVVSSGREAVELARSRSFDLVLMDLGLETNEAGVDYMREIRTIDNYAAVPIIAFTAHALPGEAERFRQLGFDDYLGKPFTGQALEDVLSRSLSSAR